MPEHIPRLTAPGRMPKLPEEPKYILPKQPEVETGQETLGFKKPKVEKKWITKPYVPYKKEQ